MTKKKSRLSYIEIGISVIISASSAYAAWLGIPSLEATAVQALGASVSTVSGVLFGFALASISVLISAGDNTLVRNTKLTGSFSSLLFRLQITMACHLFSCLIFLAALFVPISASSPFFEDLRLVSLVILAGVFVFVFSICLFASTARKFHDFSAAM